MPCIGIASSTRGCLGLRQRLSEQAGNAARENDLGELIDSAKVQMGFGSKVTGRDGAKGEVVGEPAPGTLFDRLKMGEGHRHRDQDLGPL